MDQEKDKLENYISNNKSSFEEEFDHNAVWEQLEKKLHQKKHLKINWLAAASILLLLAVGWLVTDRYYLNQRVNQLENLTVGDRSYQEIESFYFQTVNHKTELLREISSDGKSAIDNELESLQTNYKDLKRQLKDGIPHQKIIDAMIWNLRAQVEIIENHLEILEGIKEYSAEQNQKQNEKSI